MVEAVTLLQSKLCEPTEQYHLFYQFLDPGKVKETGKPYDCTGL